MTPLSSLTEAPVVLSAMLARYRRRQTFVAVTANGLVAALVVSAIAVPLFVLLPISSAIRFGVLLACAGSIGAATIALVRTPPMRRIAAIADARLGLDDCLVAAFQFIDDPDVVSRLIVRDAAVRAADVSPADVFPFHAPARIAWIGAAALAAAMVTVMALRQSAIEPPPADAAGPRMQDRGGTAKAPGGVSTPAGSAVGVASPGDRTATPSVPDRSDAREGTAPSGLSDRMDASRDSARARSAENRAGQDDRSVDDVGPQGPRPLPGDLVSRGRSPMTSSDRSGAGGSGSRGRSQSDTAGGISAGSGQAGVLSGGMPGTRDASRPPASSDGQDARYRESVGRAEAAVASERIPPGLRAYWKAYFAAINTH